jgi:hypothetical protein
MAGSIRLTALLALPSKVDAVAQLWSDTHDSASARVRVVEPGTVPEDLAALCRIPS